MKPKLEILLFPHSLFFAYSGATIEKGHLRSLFQLSGFRLAVEDALHLPVDMITSDSSDPDFLEMIRKEEVLLYRNP